MAGLTYRDAGVDIEAGEQLVERIKPLAQSTRSEHVLGSIGGFAGLCSLPSDIEDPVLVSGTDGVGTKVLVAQQAGRFDTVGECLVNHSVNDILVHGARPLAFMDYIAGAGLSIDVLADIVEGVARGCRAHGMDLAGGETAQMPGLYAPGHFDLAGTIVGVVEESEALHGDAVVPWDILLGYASSGLHTNGYTLARKIVSEDLSLGIHDQWPAVGQTVAEALLAVHRSYVRAVTPVLGRLHAVAHITGGGIPGNLVRVLPAGAEAVVEAGSWEWPALFRALQEGGKVSTAEMRDVFNLGIGLIAVLPRDAVEAARAAATADGVETWVVGRVKAGSQGVRFTA